MDTARAAALSLIGEVTENGRLLSEISDDVLAPLSGPERARAQRLALTALRWRDRADRALGPHLRMKPRPEVLNILRLALSEIYVDGTAPHGAVGAAVDLARASETGKGQAGLVNGVLRNILRKGPDAWQALPVPRLPKWLRKPLVADYGKEAIAGMELAFAAGAPLDLTVRDDVEGWAEKLGGEVLPTGSVRLARAGQVSKLPGYDEGAWWVQDAAAALPARLLGDVAGLEVLDMCAAPGGKTMQLAAAGAKVTALDLSETRMARVTENLARTGLSATTVTGDAMEHEGSYDAILLDAPCSATGTIRRHPDLPHARHGEGITELIGLQEAMFDHALRLLRPGGRLVFCTCSLIPDEGECHVEEALARHPGLEVLPAEAPGIEDRWRSAEGGLRLRPDFWAERGGMDGFYMAHLRKAG